MSLTSEPWTRWPSRWSSCLVSDSSVNTKHESEWFMGCLPFWGLYLRFIKWNHLNVTIFPFICPSSRINRNKLLFLPELLFQSNPKLGRLWVHLSRFSISPSQSPAFLSGSLPLSLSPSPFLSSFHVLHDPFENKATVQCQNFDPGGGFKSLSRWHSAALCPCGEVKRSVCMCVCAQFKEVKVGLERMFCLDLGGIFIWGIWSFPRSFGV